MSSSAFHSLPTSTKPTPPLRGSFPLDHEGECKTVMRDYLECMRKHRQFHEPCQQQSRAYLECRMERDLMAKEDLSKWGFDSASPSAVTSTATPPPTAPTTVPPSNA